jgi:hypothetical protein
MALPGRSQSQEIRNIYLHYGAAMHMVDALEKALVDLLALFDSVGPHAKEGEELRQAIRENLRRPLGDIVSRLRDHVTVDIHSDGLLRKAVEARNVLVHRFFREHARDFTNEVGRSQIFEQLIRMFVDIFRAVSLLMAPDDIAAECVSPAGREAWVTSLERLKLLAETWRGVFPEVQSANHVKRGRRSEWRIARAEIAPARSPSKRKP